MKKTISLVLVLALGPASASLAAEDTWTTKADMPTARWGLSTSVVNGKIYAIGGTKDASSAPLSTVEEYDPTTDTWTRKADMPTPRVSHSTSAVNGKIYAIGGKPAHGVTPFSTVEEYDPATDTWGRKADMPTARFGLSTCVVQGKIYAIGGDSGWNPGTYVALSTVEAYDPDTDTWITKADMPTARLGLSTSVANGKIYAIGGLLTLGGAARSTVEEYDSATDTWITKADTPTARFWLSASAVNGKIYVIGGSVKPWPSWQACSIVEEYDPNPLVVDFNGDFKVDIEDLIILIEYWGQDDPMCDIAPRPFGDGIVDVLDLELLMSYWGQEIPDPALLAHWKLDETEGDIAYDSVGVYDGVLNGVPMWQPTSGAVDGALAFDGVDDCVSTPFVLNPADGPFSVIVWVKGGAPGQVVISQTELGGANWLLADSSEGNLMTELKALGRGAAALLSQTVITDGNWHRVGFVWDGSQRTLYVDGVAVAEDTQDGLESSEGGLYIGTGKTLDAGSLFSGLIDDVRIYNRVVIP